MLSIFETPRETTPRKSYSKIPQILEMPHLIQTQLNSFRRFMEEGLKELLDEISPIKDFAGTRLELHFLDYKFRNPKDPECLQCGAWSDTPQTKFCRLCPSNVNPKHSEEECRNGDMTYSAPLYVRVHLLIKETGEIKEQDIFMGDLPLMTSNGVFIINGVERVVVSQLIRSPGVYFTREEDVSSGRWLCYAKLIPERGTRLEFETSSKDAISVKVNGKRKIPITTVLRAIGYGDDEKLVELFKGVNRSTRHDYIQATMERDAAVRNEKDALIEFYKRLRPGDPLNVENARNLIKNLLFNSRRYNLGKVGRYKLNKRLGLDVPLSEGVLTKEDLIEIVRHVIMVNNGDDSPDDIDHLGNRRVRTAGELLQNQFRIAMLRMERVIKERMSIVDIESVTPSVLINVHPVVAAMREFFGASQLSQFMDQTNPLGELTHKRRISCLGPGGLLRERAGFEVRDVHHSHYGRICPIETPEGPNIGLINSLATYSKVNDYGLIETSYRHVIRELPGNSENLVGRTVTEAVLDDSGHPLVKPGTLVTPKIAQRLSGLPERVIKIVPFVHSDIVYLSADEEEKYIIAQVSEPLDERNQFINERIEVRQGGKFSEVLPEKVDLMDVSPKQIVSVSSALIPFLEHDDANRALMGSNMQRQSVPLICPESPLIGTGMERQAACDSGQVILSKSDGVVTSIEATKIVVQDNSGEEEVYPLRKFARSNQGTCINQRPLVSKGDLVVQGQALADGPATDQGELALGQNVLCAFMSWEGYNFEDAVVISESLVREDKFTSIHIEKHESEARDTKLGPEEITRDIPNVGEESLRNLDEDGIVRTGAEVKPGDILVGKITPKGETELSAEEKLLRAIFGEKARDVKDSSLRVPHGEWGTVIGVRIFARKSDDDLPLGVKRRESGTDLPPGVNKLVRVWVAQKRKISEGDKMAGRHGNKGVIARILPDEDMPFLPDGRHVELILNPIGVPSRMNLGQVLETHLGWAANTLGFKALSPVFDGADNDDIQDSLAQAWLAQHSGAISQDPEEEHTFQFEQTKAWLAERGYDAERIFSDDYKGEARKACLRLWLESVGEKSEDLSDEEIAAKAEQVAKDSGLPIPIWGKTILYDGRTGEPFDQSVTVGYIYIMKLIHLVEDKIHARSTGPYSLITQQPLGGKAQFGGQRFGEMEVWALEAYGAAHILQELLTVKSDDVVGRAKTYESIIKGEDILQPGVPESFKVLVKELQSLGLAVEVLNEEEDKMSLVEDLGLDFPRSRTGGFQER